MAFKRHGEKYENSDVRSATAGGAISDRYCVILIAEDTITHNTVAGDVRAVGIALDTYASGDKTAQFVNEGRIEFFAEGSIAVNDALTPAATAGAFRKAQAGEFTVGRALKAASTTERCLGEFDFAGAVGGLASADKVVYYNAAITANTNVTLPNVAGTYLIESLYIKETASANVTGGVTVGTTAGGTELFTAITVASGTAYYKGPSDAVALAITLAAASPLSIQSSNWNSASIIFSLTLRRIY